MIYSRGSITSSDINIVFELLNFRYFNNLPVIVSSELCVSKLMELDEAIGSRLIEMCRGNLVEIRGSKLNYRMYR